MQAGSDIEEAIVLRRVAFSESDLIVSLLCAASGRMDAFAAGARKSQRRFAGGIDGFSLLEVQVRPSRGEGLARLLRSENIESWPHILASQLTLNAAAHFVALLEATSVSGEADVPLFSFALRVLRWLNTPSMPPEEVIVGLLRAQLVLLQHHGFLSSVDVCARSGASIRELRSAALVPGEGLVAQAELRGDEETLRGEVLSSEALRILASLLAREQPGGPGSRALQELTVALHRCWAVALEREPKTWRAFYGACQKQWGWR